MTDHNLQEKNRDLSPNTPTKFCQNSVTKFVKTHFPFTQFGLPFTFPNFSKPLLLQHQARIYPFLN